MLDMAPDASDRYLIVDEDGEDAFIRAGNIAALICPLRIVELDFDDHRQESE